MKITKNNTWLDNDQYLRMWHESSWWARFWFKTANFCIKRSLRARELIFAAVEWNLLREGRKLLELEEISSK